MSENDELNGGEPPEEREPLRAGGSSRRLKIVVVVLLALPLLVAVPLLIWGQGNRLDDGGGGIENLVFGTEDVLGVGPENLDVETLDGEAVTLDSLSGKWVVVDFWAPWCPPCRQEAPELAKAYERWRFRGVEFVGIASFPRGDYERMVREFVEAEDVPFPVALDAANSALALNFGVVGLPEKFIITPEGELHSTKLVGPVTAERLDGILDNLVGSAP